MLLESFLSLSLILPGLLVLRAGKFKFSNFLELISFSYIVSLALNFGLLYLGGITGSFNLMCLLLLLIVLLSLAYLSALLINRVIRLVRLPREPFFPNITGTKAVLIFSIVALLAIFAVVLTSRAIFDSDVAQFYLPLAREIAITNGFTYGTGIDYVVLLKPIGVSVLYAWAYVISGSVLSEPFRLMPLIPILIAVILNYQISTLVTKSQAIGIISSAVFVILPFQDRLLLYSAFYPDTFYYPLIFMAIYLLTKCYQTRDNRFLFWAGLSLGVASLLKAQTIYFLIAFLVVVIVFELNSKPLSFVICFLGPFLILVPSILAVAVQRHGLEMFLPTLSYEQIALLLLASTLSGICYFLVSRHDSLGDNIHGSGIRILIRKMILILVPFLVLSALWYVSNMIKFGTIIYTSSINLPNYDWALGLLNSIQTPQIPADFWHYAAYFMFIFVHPAVMGYVMLVPFLIGLFLVIRKMPQAFRVFFLFEMISVLIIICNVVISISSGTLGYNPRDILPLAPLLATLSAIGIAWVTKKLYRSNNNKFVYLSLVLVAYFGFMNYVHSVFVWYFGLRNPNIFSQLMSGFAGLAGLNLPETSYQLSYASGVVFVGENLVEITLLSLLAGIPVLALMAINRLNLASGVRKRIGYSSQRNLVSKRSPTKSKLVMNLLVISLIVIVIMPPRVGVYDAQSNLQEMKERQLQDYYDGFYKLLGMQFQGDILTFKCPPGLPYYLPGIKIIDLAYAGNIAFLKDCFQYNSSTEAAAKFKQYGILYILIMPYDGDTQQLDARLNFTLSRIIQDPTVANLSVVFAVWRTYELV